MTEEKVDKLDFIKYKLLCFKGFYQGSEKIMYIMRKTFANNIFDKE